MIESGRPYAQGSMVDRAPGPPVGQLERPDAEAMAVVQRTAASVANRPVALAEAFYRHLFELAPEARAMFPKDMTAQNEKLCRALFGGIHALARGDQDVSAMEWSLHQLGVHHTRQYEVQPEHYPFVGHALVRAVRDLSLDWSTSCSSSWIWVYNWMSGHMLRHRQ